MSLDGSGGRGIRRASDLESRIAACFDREIPR